MISLLATKKKKYTIIKNERETRVKMTINDEIKVSYYGNVINKYTYYLRAHKY